MGAIRGNFEILNPNKVEMRLTISMTVEDWIMVKNKLIENKSDMQEYYHPASELNRAIVEMMEKAQKEFHFYSIETNGD